MLAAREAFKFLHDQSDLLGGLLQGCARQSNCSFFLTIVALTFYDAQEDESRSSGLTLFSQRSQDLYGQPDPSANLQAAGPACLVKSDVGFEVCSSRICSKAIQTSFGFCVQILRFEFEFVRATQPLRVVALTGRCTLVQIGASSV